MKIAHLIGNGPSKKLFKNLYPEVPIFGCNLGEPSLPMTATFIMDQIVLNHIQIKGLHLNYPVIVPEALENHVRKYVPVKIYDTVEYELVNGESTGHKAVEYLLEKGFTEIQMWGFDSLKEDNVDSDTHAKMPQALFDPKNYLRWRERWKEIFSSEAGKKCQFVIHSSS